MNWRALGLLVFPLLVHADYQSGLDAFYSGEYEVAMEEWLAVAEGLPGSVSPGEFMEAHYAIAMLYWNGLGVQQDYSKAHDWLIQPAQMGHADAESKLGVLYSHGTGVELDYVEAFEWFTKAAKQGNIDAIYNLGVLYLNGWGTERDTTMAKQYLAQASALGDIAAEKVLQGLLTEPETESAAVDQGSTAPDTTTTTPVTTAPETAAQATTARVTTEPGSAGPVAEPKPAPIILADESWIRARPPEHYTIQVIALSAREKIEALVEEHESLAPFALYTLNRNGRTLFVLVQGDYPNKEAAMEVRDGFALSREISDPLWVRQFGQIQALIEH